MTPNCCNAFPGFSWFVVVYEKAKKKKPRKTEKNVKRVYPACYSTILFFSVQFSSTLFCPSKRIFFFFCNFFWFPITTTATLNYSFKREFSENDSLYIHTHTGNYNLIMIFTRQKFLSLFSSSFFFSFFLIYKSR